VTRASVFAISLVLAACSGDKQPETKPADGKAPPPAGAPDAGGAVAVPGPDAAAGAQVADPDAIDTNPEPGVGQDFIAEARLLFRVVACGTEEPVPKPLNARVVDGHCRRLRAVQKRYRDKYLAVAGPFIANLRPADIPRRVVYPFGGGDLLSALTTFPDALEITTISLEFAGDPRRITNLRDRESLQDSLNLLNETMATLLFSGWNFSKNLKLTQRGELPGQLAYALVALAIHGQEPVSLRYFRFRDDGTIDYLDAEEIAAVEDKVPKKLRSTWTSPDYSEAFSNMELRFRKQGGGDVHIHRHVAFNLDDEHLTADPRLLKHLEAKGRVSAMTRAAAYLLWLDNFTKISGYLTTHLEWMISDSTGLPPPVAEAAGLEQETYGKFEGAFEPTDNPRRTHYNEAFTKLWKSQPYRKLPFRYGYPDVNKQFHMVITRRPR
jgi:hypothetical protein